MSGHRRRLVVQVVPYYPPHLGGMENVAKSIAEGLAQTGPVEVLTSTTGPGRATLVERRGDLVVRRIFTAEFASLPFMPTLLFHLLCLPRRAVVHVHVAQAYVPEMVWLAGWLRRRPYLAHYHLDVEPSGRLGSIFVAYKRLILGPMLRAAARVIVLSPEQAIFVVRTFSVDESRIAILPNGVGAEFFRAAHDRPVHGGRCRLLFVGRLSPQKNVSRLLEAMAKVGSPAELVIVGDGQEREMLERLCADLALDNVRMVGAMTGEALTDWYRWADVFVLASDKEGMPLVLLEAMATGLPIVGTDVAGISDTVAGVGLLAQPDPAALAEAIDRVAGDPVLRADLAGRSRQQGSNYAWTTLLESLQGIYDSIDQ